MGWWRNEWEGLCFPMDDFTSHIQTKFYKVNQPQSSPHLSFAGMYDVPAACFLGGVLQPMAMLCFHTRYWLHPTFWTLNLGLEGGDCSC